MNLSLGHRILESAATDPLVQAVEAASRAGIVVVVSAGNVGKNPETGEVGYAGITSPGNAPSAITVGSVNTNQTTQRSDDRVADYSSRGPTWYDGFAKPDVVAAGHRLPAPMAATATLWQNYPSMQVEPGYMRLSGTSMATGVVSGVTALMLQAQRAESPVTAPKLTGNTRPSPFMTTRASRRFSWFRAPDP
jgi:serine protease AprX